MVRAREEMAVDEAGDMASWICSLCVVKRRVKWVRGLAAVCGWVTMHLHGGTAGRRGGSSLHRSSESPRPLPDSLPLAWATK